MEGGGGSGLDANALASLNKQNRNNINNSDDGGSDYAGSNDGRSKSKSKLSDETHIEGLE